jgi:hypothetical protein
MSLPGFSDWNCEGGQTDIACESALRACRILIEFNRKTMLEKKPVRKKEPDVYYLLPGMAKMARQRFFRNLKISVVVGILVALVIAGLLYYKDKIDGF